MGRVNINRVAWVAVIYFYREGKEPPIRAYGPHYFSSANAAEEYVKNKEIRGWYAEITPRIERSTKYLIP